MTPYIIAVLTAAWLQSCCKLALTPRRRRWLLPGIPALAAPIAQPWLVQCGRLEMEQFLSGVPELETLCVIAVMQELASLAAGWPLIAGNCRFRRLRSLALAPSLLLIPGVLYVQLNGFLSLPGVAFGRVSAAVAAGLWLATALGAETAARFCRTRDAGIETLLSAESLFLLLTLFLPVLARNASFLPGTETMEVRSLAVLGTLVGGVAGFALLAALRDHWKNKDCQE